jgi:hypothetical protein
MSSKSSESDSDTELSSPEFSFPGSLYRELVSESSGDVHVIWLLPHFCFVWAAVEAFEWQGIILNGEQVIQGSQMLNNNNFFLAQNLKHFTENLKIANFTVFSF